MNTAIKYLPLALASVLLAACGTSGTTTPAGFASISGTVPGTKIEAFCDNGSYYVTHSDKTKGNTTTPPRHPFSLTMPAGVGCHIVMTMNDDNPGVTDVVQPIGFKNKAGKIETRLVLGAGNKVVLGNVNLYKTSQAATDVGLTVKTVIDGSNQSVDVLDKPFVLDDHATTGAKNPLETADADNNGVPDMKDDPATDGQEMHSGAIDSQDPDGNGIPNKYEMASKRPAFAAGVKDSDHDGVPDNIDVNKDNKAGQNIALPNSKDGYLDSDKNHDGFPDGDTNHDGLDNEMGDKPDGSSLNGTNTAG